jgi:hypothetical protein
MTAFWSLSSLSATVSQPKLFARVRNCDICLQCCQSAVFLTENLWIVDSCELSYLIPAKWDFNVFNGLTLARALQYDGQGRREYVKTRQSGKQAKRRIRCNLPLATLLTCFSGFHGLGDAIRSRLELFFPAIASD